MTPKVLQPRPDAAAGNTAKLLVYITVSGAVAVGAVLLRDRLPPALLGGGLFLYFVAGALFALRCRRRELQAIAPWRDLLPCYVAVLDRDLRIVDGNALFRRDYGDREGEHCFEVFKCREDPCPECVALEVMRDGVVRTHESTVRKKDGSEARIVSTTSAARDAEGKVVAAVEVFTDISEIHALRQELERARKDYKRIFDALPSHASVLRPDLTVATANMLYRRDFGGEAGARCYEVCKNRRRPCEDCLVARTFEDGQVHSSEERLITKDGRTLDMVVYSMPLTDEDGEISAVMEVFTDITEVKRLESKLALMGRAVAGIAHRIKNILMGLEGGIFVFDTAREDEDAGNMAQGWEMVKKNVHRVSRIVKDLLYCSKERVPRLRPGVDPAEVAREVHDLYRERLAAESIDLRLEIPEPPGAGTYDPDGLHNLLTNLVANAIDACRFDQDESKDSHTITLGCARGEKGGVVYTVADTGPGIPEEFSGKVFQDFFSTKGTEGTGIGLLVVQKVAEEHGGAVTFESRPGEGTTFRVTIPPPAT